MTMRQARVTQAEVERVLRAAKAVHGDGKPLAVEVLPNGAVRVYPCEIAPIVNSGSYGDNPEYDLRHKERVPL